MWYEVPFMNNYKKNLFTFFSTYFLALTIFAVMPCDGKVKSHENHVRFESQSADKVKCVTFQLTDHCITAKQPFDLKANSFMPHLDNDHMTLTVNAGRKRSSSPAKCFNNWVGKKNVFGKHVDSLNFAMRGTLKLYSTSNCDRGSLLGEFDNMALGQGHSEATDNWWMGGEKCSSVTRGGKIFHSTNSMQCTSKEGDTWAFLRAITEPTVIKIFRST